MKEQLIRLLKLQELDEKTNDARQTLEAAPAQIQELDEQLAKFVQLLQNEKDQLEETAKWQRDQESRLKDEEQQTLKTKQQLQQVRTAREYTALQRQMDGARKAVGEREEEILKLMDAVEGFKATIAQHEKEFDELKGHLDAERQEIEASIQDAEARKAAITAEREELASQIDVSLLRQYERIYERKRPAMVDVKGATCGGCKMRVRPQLYNELFRADSLKTCPNCQRLIYLSDALFPEETEGETTPEST